MAEIRGAYMYIKSCTYKKDLEEAIKSVQNLEKIFGKTFLITGATGGYAFAVLCSW